LLADVVRQANHLDSKRGLSLDIPTEVSVLADPDALKQVMLITLDNALKHSQGAIEVFAHQRGAQVELCVKDYGVGISPEKLELVFDRFYRVNDGFIANGFGLGLPIAKAQTEGMGGTITLESELGVGSTVVLLFPSPGKNGLLA
jgi:signal transduction histidine kinase